MLSFEVMCPTAALLLAVPSAEESVEHIALFL